MYECHRKIYFLKANRGKGIKERIAFKGQLLSSESDFFILTYDNTCNIIACFIQIGTTPGRGE